MKTVDYLEAVLKKKRAENFRDQQILILIALARKGKSMRLMELVEATGCSRQVVFQALEMFMMREVEVKRPSRVETVVSIQEPGVAALGRFLNFEKKD